jgi:hypothetical protein
MFEGIIDSYNRAILALNVDLEKDRSEEHANECAPLHDALFTKWGDKIPKGWYGFDLPLYLPKTWFLVIDDVLDELNQKYPDFEINQIKLKFGGIRMYLDKIPREVEADISKIEKLLYDKVFIY